MRARSDDTGDRRVDRIVFLHGFTQTHHHWHPCAHLIAARSGGDPTLAFVDLPGHGLSAADDLGIISAAAPLTALAGPGTYIGYSMGGRFALASALAEPGTVRQLVLIGATAGLDDPAQCASRLQQDDERADQVVELGVDAFLERWLAAPLFTTLAADRRGIEHRRRNTATGLAHSLRWSGTGNMGSSMWEALRELPVPVLVIAGALDHKFTAIGRRMADLLPGGTFTSIAGSGHAAHVERPDLVSAAIVDWLRSRSA